MIYSSHSSRSTPEEGFLENGLTNTKVLSIVTRFILVVSASKKKYVAPLDEAKTMRVRATSPRFSGLQNDFSEFLSLVSYINVVFCVSGRG